MENKVHMLKGSMFGNNVMNKDKGRLKRSGSTKKGFLQKECNCKISYRQCLQIFRHGSKHKGVKHKDDICL